jgi:CheY-like chemotaxis protein
VLVVDDLRDAADILALLLESYGAETRCVYSGADGIEQARSWRPDVALVDIGLPDMTGYEVARAIRLENGPPRMLLLAVTGYGDPASATNAAEAGFDGRLVKPIDHDRLHELIAERVKPAAG